MDSIGKIWLHGFLTGMVAGIGAAGILLIITAKKGK